jgi:hypothetical protein
MGKLPRLRRIRSSIGRGGTPALILADVNGEVAQVEHKITIEPVRFASILYTFQINQFTSLR